MNNLGFYPAALYGTLKALAQTFTGDVQTKKAAMAQYEQRLRDLIDLLPQVLNQENAAEIVFEYVVQANTYLRSLLRTLSTDEEKAASVPHVRALFMFLHEVDRAVLEAQTGYDWLVEPSGGGTYKITRKATGMVYSGIKEPIPTIMGSDRNSASAKNRYPLSGFQMGQVIALMPGEYPKFRVTRTIDINDGVQMGLDSDNKIRPDQVTFGKDPNTVIKALVPGTVFILPDTTVGGTKTLYIEWGGAVTFIGLIFIADDQAGIATENHHEVNEWQHFRNIEFIDCEIRGSWSAYTNEGWRSKWGLFTYGIGLSNDARPGFSWTGGSIHGIKEEHTNYNHWFNSGSPDLVAFHMQDVDLYHCGRTASQHSPREGEEPAGVESQGVVIYRDVRVRDVCLQSGGGGSAFTVAGNFVGRVSYQDCFVQLGCDEALAPDLRDRITGSIVAWMGEGAEGQPNDIIEILGGRYEVGLHYVGSGSARRPNVSISNTKHFRLISAPGKHGNGLIWSHPGCSSTMRLDVLTIDKLTLDSKYEVRGDVYLDAQKFPDAENDGSGWKAALNVLAGNPKVEIF